MLKRFIRYAFTLAAGVMGAAAGQAQGPAAYGAFLPYQTPGNYPNASTNRSVQPLSPYLNLFRGGLPAVNYYYGVRPSLSIGGPGSSSGPAAGPRPIRPAFLPASPPGEARDPLPAGFEYTATPKETTLSPAGHAVQFANTIGIAPGLAAPRPGGFTKPAKK